MNKRMLFLFLLTTYFSLMSSALSADEIIVPASADNEITVNRFKAPGKYLIVWLSPEYGFRKAHQTMAERLTKESIEVWQSNIPESLFMTQGTNSIKQLDGTYVADIIAYAHKTTGKKILVAGDSYASLSALRGAHKWQQRNIKTSYLVGAILFSPYTFAYIPPLGLPPEFMPVVSATNIPIMIYQSKNSGIIGQFEALLENLRKHKSPVYTKYIPDVMSMFYQKKPTKAMINGSALIPKSIKQMIPVLEAHPTPDSAIKLASKKEIKSGIDVYLRKFTGNNPPVSINLNTVSGETFTKSNFKGKITVINFWATWCPPCIEEIPSLNRLMKKMEKRPFELISINYAEERNLIQDFMKKVNVEFPVLLDQNGEFAKQWNVISYPSTFIINKQGKIVYGVNSAIEWDNPELIDKINEMF